MEWVLRENVGGKAMKPCVTKGINMKGGAKAGSRMTSAAVARIQSATARNNAGKVATGSFAARAQAAAAKSGGK